MILKTLFLFLLGNILGSFLNVVVFRYKPGGSVLGSHLGGRSKCPHCGKKLNWYELIPVMSFVVQLGKCRGCGKPISWRYPVIEILSGIILATVPLVLGFTPQALIWAVALLLLLAASFIDIRHYVIPDGLTISLALLGVAFTLMIALGKVGGQALVPGTFLGSYAYIFSFTNNPWVARLVASLASGAFFFLIILLSRGKAMGWGDAKLAAAAGLLLGWPDAILAIMLAFVLGALFGMVALISNKKGLKDAIPFGPFIAIGTAVVFYFGQNILSLYFNFLNLAA
jgi:leader peptidase (prepilin peptidase) / N-methyltransferase